jgi:hypothetical protein
MTSLTTLNDYLFDQLDRISADTLTPEQLAAEVTRAGAIVGLADKITDNARTQLAAAKLFAEHGPAVLPHLPQIAPPKTTGGAK